MVVGRLLSHWEGSFSGAMLNFQGVHGWFSKCHVSLSPAFSFSISGNPNCSPKAWSNQSSPKRGHQKNWFQGGFVFWLVVEPTHLKNISSGWFQIVWGMCFFDCSLQQSGEAEPILFWQARKSGSGKTCRAMLKASKAPKKKLRPRSDVQRLPTKRQSQPRCWGKPRKHQRLLLGVHE